MTPSLPDLETLRSGGKRALARMLTRLETEAGSPEIAAFLDEACETEGGHVLGLTGPPGVGKSTLTDALIRLFRAQGERVSVLAIDPSSSLSGGALLGDRTRLRTDPEDDLVFVRSMAARDRLGGLSDEAMAAIALLRAVSDRVIVETVGVGQSESDLKHCADTVVLCVQPGSGDSLQFMKAGIMEVPDIVCVTKADMGAVARRAGADVSGALSLAIKPAGWTVPVCEVSAISDTGLTGFIESVERHRQHLATGGLLRRNRAAQHLVWLEDMIRARYGQAGMQLHGGKTSGAANEPQAGPFSEYQKVRADLDRKLGLS